MNLSARGWRERDPTPPRPKNAQLEWLPPQRVESALADMVQWVTSCGRYCVWRSVSLTGNTHRFVAGYATTSTKPPIIKGKEVPNHWCYLVNPKLHGYYPREFKALSTALEAVEDYHCSTTGVGRVESNVTELLREADELEFDRLPYCEGGRKERERFSEEQVMNVSKKNLVSLLQGLGYPNADKADKWDLTRLSVKVGKLQHMTGLEEARAKLDAPMQEMLADILKTTKTGKMVKIIEEDEEGKPVKVKPPTRPVASKPSRNGEAKPKKDAAEKDAFGCRAGSQAALINAAVGKKPKTIDAIAEESGSSKARVKAHLAHWEKKNGCFSKDAKGSWFIANGSK